ncbi:hypothetical protein JNW90_09000 [Micromonospora sp. STR1s_5]|nr:hypothetical protein [Micromonospora sp. STR1s_5]
MSTRTQEQILATVLAHTTWTTPAPTAGGVETGPGTSDSRPGPRIVQLAALLDQIAQDPPVGPLLADLDAAMARSRAARGAGA